MPGKGYSGIVDAAVFVVLEIAAVFMLSHTQSLQDIWINRASHRTLGAIWGGSENVRNYFRLRAENEELSGENARMSESLRKYHGRELAMAGAISDTIVGHYTYTPATIIKMSRNTQHNYIVLDKGRADGVTPGCGVVAANGVVGIVRAADERFSYGLTLQNSLISVSARIGHTGTVAPLEWSGGRSDVAVLKNLPTHLEVTPGDTVWTSGFSGIFPPDIPLGITGKTRGVDGAVKEARVDLFLDFSALRYVSIVENRDKAEIAKLEKEAEEQL